MRENPLELIHATAVEFTDDGDAHDLLRRIADWLEEQGDGHILGSISTNFDGEQWEAVVVLDGGPPE